MDPGTPPASRCDHAAVISQAMEEARLIGQARPEAGGLEALVRSVYPGTTKFRDQTIQGSLRGLALRGVLRYSLQKKRQTVAPGHNVL